jgi:hypothetical protein
MLVKRIGDLGAVFLIMFPTSLAHVGKEKNTDPYIRDKMKLHFLERFSQEMLVEPIGHLGVVFSNSDFAVFL